MVVDQDHDPDRHTTHRPYASITADHMNFHSAGMRTKALGVTKMMAQLVTQI